MKQLENIDIDNIVAIKITMQDKDYLFTVEEFLKKAEIIKQNIAILEKSNIHVKKQGQYIPYLFGCSGLMLIFVLLCISTIPAWILYFGILSLSGWHGYQASKLLKTLIKIEN